MKINRATMDDMDFLVAMAPKIIGETQLEHFAEFHEPTMRSTLRRMMESPTATIIMARDDMSTIGFIGGNIIASYWNSHAEIASHLFWWVHPEMRGKGAGRVLRQQFEKWATKNGVDRVTFTLPPTAYQALPDSYRALETLFVKEL